MFAQFFAIYLVAVLACQASRAYASCEATVKSFSSHDATILTQLGYIAEFSIECNPKSELSLFAELPSGKVVPVAKIRDNKYQVSWVEELSTARGGNIELRLFDEDGYTYLRKAIRNGDKVSSVKSLLDITVSIKNAYKGPWVKAELLAAFLVGGMAYFAVTNKSKVQA
ncbi:uncharacterized protein Dwil_GK23102 [Drosophila willistoni]|uniref:Translocon-associated protein subunit delta n=1 Tax=Drosophila willistoni TaxID=7260 RepID=B4NMD4_DROWI|nr:translocon-associated protein subunit delta [Drosophila willistoni]EDW85523.1 uncharacterized protein Dwil_GK23102 [Drosophila willistoni]